MVEDLEEEEEVPVRGCGPEGPRADEQLLWSPLQA